MLDLQTTECKVKIRPRYAGRDVREGAHILDGANVMLRPMWEMKDDGPYPGELAMTPVGKESESLFEEAGIIWIASGDVVIA